jgi:hypothetical protein
MEDNAARRSPRPELVQSDRGAVNHVIASGQLRRRSAGLRCVLAIPHKCVLAQSPRPDSYPPQGAVA